MRGQAPPPRGKRAPPLGSGAALLGVSVSSSCVALGLAALLFALLLAPSLLFLYSPSLPALPFPFPFSPRAPSAQHSADLRPDTASTASPHSGSASGKGAPGAADVDADPELVSSASRRASPGRAGRSSSSRARGEGGPGKNGESAGADAMAAITAAAAASIAAKDFVSRKVLRKLLSREQGEGDGARVRRSIGRPEMRSLDPFLMLDEFRVAAPAGFPDHPHRGFETVTYVLKGQVWHEDFDGHKGVIGPGDLQWMTAGRGIMHAEMPGPEGECHGLQLWVNLGSKDKMVPSSYQELLDKDIPKVEKDGVHVAVIAGESMGITSPVHTRTPTMYLSFRMAPGSHHRQGIPETWNAFVYTLSGKATFGEESAEPIGAHYTVELGPGKGLDVWNKGDQECSFVLIGGQPVGEPVVQYGPFVMNTEDEIMGTLRDFQLGRNGFDKAKGWRSTIRDGV